MSATVRIADARSAERIDVNGHEATFSLWKFRYQTTITDHALSRCLRCSINSRLSVWLPAKRSCAWRIGNHSKYQMDFQSRSCRMSLIALFRFPVNKIEFPDTCFYFPVLGFREIACNSLKTRGNNRPNCVFEAKMTKIPCFFPVKQGNPLRRVGSRLRPPPFSRLAICGPRLAL